MATDKVIIEGLKTEAVIGVYDWEREIRQHLFFDLELATDIRPAAETDDIKLTLDYFEISKRIIHWVGDSEFQLIETLAEQLAALLMEEFNIKGLKMKVSKPGAVSEANNVAVLIERGQI